MWDLTWECRRVQVLCKTHLEVGPIVFSDLLRFRVGPTWSPSATRTRHTASLPSEVLVGGCGSGKSGSLHRSPILLKILQVSFVPFFSSVPSSREKDLGYDIPSPGVRGSPVQTFVKTTSVCFSPHDDRRLPIYGSYDDLRRSRVPSGVPVVP